MTWPSAVATTTLPLATAQEHVTGEAASYSQTFLPLARSSPWTRPSLEPTNTRPPAIAGDESTRARVVNVQRGLPHPDYRARRAALNRVTADVADRV